MSTRRVELRMKVELADWVDGYADSRGSTKTAVIEAGVRALRDLAQGGVPDLETASSGGPSGVRAPVAASVSGSAPSRGSDQRQHAMARQQVLNKGKYGGS